MDSLLSWSTGLRIPLCRRSGSGAAGAAPSSISGSSSAASSLAAPASRRRRAPAESARLGGAPVDGSAGRELLAAAAEGEDPKAWKWRIRKRIWDLMEAEGIAQNPRPVHHRIPNFVGANTAADALGGLDAFQKAQCVKVNPDSPQKMIRLLTLAGGKTLLTPQPRLRTGFFSVLESRMLPAGSINEACTSVGVAKYGKPIGLDEKIKVDLIVVGSVAVDPSTGARLGKGEMGAADDSTWIVTSVHDRQLVDDIPAEKLLVHDLPKLSPEKLAQIRILKELKRRVERESGRLLPSGPSEKLPPTAQRRRR
ncbi:unnamed protein product [Spirodela intermedia]|uniref:Uncharacterized protein n=1 Tax=Spirodela intermedia TaxID=51605 RepID=A0A7I8IUB4_SPIIN|nr:unnamed protein product [Spirodela intermedia]CAA6660557.1 unnamed protein product [Spirodela intermedia]